MDAFSTRRRKPGPEKLPLFGAAGEEGTGIASASPAAGTGDLNSGAAEDLAALMTTLRLLADACAESIEKAAQHFHGEDPWLIGALPACTQLADSVESRARGYLAHSHLSPSEVNGVTDLLKATGDLRAAARGARQATQLVALLRQEAFAELGLAEVQPVADAAMRVAMTAAGALNAGAIAEARTAAQFYRVADSARQRAEANLRTSTSLLQYSPNALRLIRASVWHCAVAAESMARVAARLVLAVS